jgi:TonB family protein
MDRNIKCSSLISCRVLLWIAFCFLGSLFTALAQEPGSQGSPYPVGPGIIAPVVLTQPLPAYTDEARAARIEGLVLLQAVVRKDGTADSFKVIHGLGYGLDESAMNTIAARWRFQPGTRNGEPVDVQVNIEVSFRFYGKPKEVEMLKSHPLRASILEAKWNQVPSVPIIGTGYGNLLTAGGWRGFTYTTECGPVFRQDIFVSAKWTEPDSNLEIVTSAEPNAVHTCELRVVMKSTAFAVRDGKAIEKGSLSPVQK